MIANPAVAQAAISRLLTGPASEVRMSSRTGCRKCRGSTGVGLAHPIMYPP